MYYVYNGEMYSEEELIHHGILGQKWGVRRFQNNDGSLTVAGKKRYDFKSAGDYKKALNKVDQGIAEEKRSLKSSARKAARYQTMAELADSRGMKSTRDRYASKAKEHLKAAEEHKANIKKGESYTWQLIGDAAAKGYSVNSKRTIRYTDKGEVFAAAILAGAVGAAAAMQYGKQKDQYRYSVKKTKKGQDPTISLDLNK